MFFCNLAPLSLVVVGDQIWAGFRSGDVAAFDLTRETLLRREVRVHQGRLAALCRVPLLNQVWSAGSDGKIFAWPVDLMDEGQVFVPRPATLIQSHNLGQILALASFDGKMIVGDSTGKVCIYGLDGALIASHQMELGERQPITAVVGGVGFDNVCWFAAGCDLYSLTLTTTQSIRVGLVAANAHDRFINCLLCIGKEVWSSHGGGNSLKVWRVNPGELRYNLPLPKTTSRIHSMALVNLRGDPVIWIGSDDEMIVFDLRQRKAVQTITSLKEGDVLCLIQTGLNCVWAGTRHKDDSGSLTEINLN